MEKELFYFINYEKEITAIGEINAHYMVERGYTLVDKEEYDRKNEEYAEKYRNEEEGDEDYAIEEIE